MKSYKKKILRPFGSIISVIYFIELFHRAELLMISNSYIICLVIEMDMLVSKMSPLKVLQMTFKFPSIKII